MTGVLRQQSRRARIQDIVRVCVICVVMKPEEIDMAKGQQRSNREPKKPKKEKIKVIAAAPSQTAHPQRL